MAAPKEITELVERFDRNRDSYVGPGYNETRVRREFLDPFFAALGWDVENKAGYAEAYKDVIHEDAIKIGGATKAPDYSFRVGGMRKFFVEAKKPASNLKEDSGPAYQLRRYAWSAKLPLSILSSFDEFTVYDCRSRPDLSDKSSVARVLYLTANDYESRWDEIAATFSKEAVLKGSFDKFAEAKKGKRGTATVDAAFLESIESWRDSLARNLAIRNPMLSQRELNYAVGKTIDRIIFLRICEDRGIERYGRLQGLINGAKIYPRLAELFQEADARYNSGLFHFQDEKEQSESPDEWTLRLSLDDKILKEILQGLYYPESPYEFSVLPAEILGQVYEQFLGKVIRLTSGHQAKVEDKPEVKKAGGVYYTPAYIVDYIVKNTVGKLLDGKTPKQASKLRVLDPACGSGSFLIGAYRLLLDWHRDWYVTDGPRKHTKELYQGPGGDWRLTSEEKRRILLNNIYGVDIDAQAVEVTKLSLLLKVLEGESDETISSQKKLFHQRALPNLAKNIKCGNSLIGPDFYKGQQDSLFIDEEDRYRVNAFDWSAEFSEIMKAGGFDAVIGNPPYVRQESLADFKDYFQEHYESFDGVADLYAYFMEKGLRVLRSGGRFSFIVSSSFLRATYAEPLRRTLKKLAAVVRVVDFGGSAVFTDAKDTYVCIPLFVKEQQPDRVEVSKVNSSRVQDLAGHVLSNHYSVPQKRFSPESWSLATDADAAVFAKVMNAGVSLGTYVKRRMFYGVKTGLNDAFEISETQRHSLVRSPGAEHLVKPFLGGQDIRRYEIKFDARYLIVIPSGWTKSHLAKSPNASAGLSEAEAWRWFARKHPALARHLMGFSDALKKRQDQGDYWWELRPCDYYEAFDEPKIIFPDIAKEPRFFLDRSGLYLSNTAYLLGVDDPYLLGLLNSRLFWFSISHISIPFGIRAGEYRYRLIYQYMERVPIRPINFSDPADRKRHGKMVGMVEEILDLNTRLRKAKTPTDKTMLERQIAATDRQIDELVYELHGLTEEEIRIVEGSAN